VTVLSLILANKVERAVPEWRSFLAVLTGTAFGLFLYLAISGTQKILSVRYPRVFAPHNAHFGVLYAVFAFSISLSFAKFRLHLTRLPFSNRWLWPDMGSGSFSDPPRSYRRVGVSLWVAVIRVCFLGEISGTHHGGDPLRPSAPPEFCLRRPDPMELHPRNDPSGPLSIPHFLTAWVDGGNSRPLPLERSSFTLCRSFSDPPRSS